MTKKRKLKTLMRKRKGLRKMTQAQKMKKMLAPRTLMSGIECFDIILQHPPSLLGSPVYKNETKKHFGLPYGSNHVETNV